MYYRKLLSITVMLALVAVLGLLPVQAQDDEPISLRYADWTTTNEDLLQEIVDICAAELGYDVTLEIYSPPADVYWPTMQTLAAAGNLPEVFAMSSAFVDEWAADNLLLNLQEFVDRDIMPVADDYFVGAFDQARFPSKIDGYMHAFPYAFVHTVMYYNMDMFDEAGLDYPSEGWTWDDFLEAAIALTDADNDQYGYWFYGRYAQIEPWIYQNNGDMLNADKTRFELDENAVQTLEWLVSLVDEHGVAPQPADMEGIRQQDMFPMGMAAMWVDGSWNITNIRNIAGDDFRWGIAPIPRGPNWVQDVAFGWPDLLAVSPFTPHQEEAWELVACITGPLRTLDLTDEGKIAIYRPVSEDEAWLEPDLMPVNKDFLLEWAQNVGPNSFTPGWGEWRGYVGGAGLEGQITEVLNGNLTLEQALDDVTGFANSVLQRFYP